VVALFGFDRFRFGFDRFMLGFDCFSFGFDRFMLGFDCFSFGFERSKLENRDFWSTQSNPGNPEPFILVNFRV
jgi:hypothetical protein